MTRKLFWMIFVAPVLGATALSAGAEESRKSAPAQSGIQLSEWGRETRLPELTASAWSETRDESELPDFGEFLSEEVRTLGAGVLDSEQLRDMMANRAIGREDDSVMSWMSSRWESAPGRLANFLTDYAETRMNALPGVESAEFNWTPTGDNAFGAFSASGVGALRLSESQALGFQPKIERAQEDGRLTGTFGLFHRRGFGDSAVAGVNIFSQHMDDPEKGSFSRWWVGADFASSWVDADFKRYIGGDGRNIWRDGRRFRAYAPDGLSAELRVHSPDMLWLEGYAKFTEWQGRGGNSDTHEKSVGVTFQPYAGPLAGLRADAELAKDKANLEFVYAWTIGEGGILPRLADPFAVYSDIADPVDTPDDFRLDNYELYEVAHLYEIGDRLGLPEGVDQAELFRRVSLTWDLVKPRYMRISEHLRAHCPVPQFISLWDETGGTFQRAAGGGNFWTAAGLCPTLNGDHTTPVNWWIGSDVAGSLLFLHAVEILDVDAVKLLVIAAPAYINDNYGGIFSNVQNPRNAFWGDASFVSTHRASVPRLRPLEGVALRASLAAANDLDDQLEKARTIAKILIANGAECRPENITNGTWEICHMALPDKTEDSPDEDYKDGAFQRKDVPNGGVFEGSVILPVAQGYTGEVFRITATTDYADVDYSMEQSGDNFSVTIAGSYRDYYGGSSWQGQETRYHYTGDTTVAVVHLTSRTATAEKHSLTVKAKFFYHRNKLNTVTSSFDVQILPHPEKITDTWGILAGEKITVLEVPELSGETFVWMGGSPQLTIQENGAIDAVGELTAGTTVTLYAGAVSPQEMRGTLKFTVEADIVEGFEISGEKISEHDKNWPTPDINYVASGHSGMLFTVTATTPNMRVSFDVLASSGWSAEITAVRDNAGEVRAISGLTDPGVRSGQVRATLLSSAGGKSTLTVDFEFTVLTMSNVKRGFATMPPGALLTLSVSGLREIEYRTVGDSQLSINERGEVMISGGLANGGESVHMVADLTAENMAGALRVTVSIYKTCVKPTRRSWSQVTRDDDRAEYDRLKGEIIDAAAGTEDDDPQSLCEALLDGGDPNVKKGLPLYLAAGTNNTVLVNMLHEFDAAFGNSTHERKNPPVISAATNGAYLTGKQVIVLGSNARAKSPTKDRNALHMLAKRERTQSTPAEIVSFVNLLIDEGVGFDDSDSLSRTPLLYAAREGDVVVARALLEEGASKYTADNRGMSPVHEIQNSMSMAELFVEQRTDLNHTTSSPKSGLRALDFVTDTAVASYLRENGALCGRHKVWEEAEGLCVDAE